MLKVVVVLLVVLTALANIDVENELSEKFTISGYLNAGFSELGAYNAVPSREFSVSRSGFELNAELTETLSAEMKLELRPDEFFLKDACFRWDPAEWTRIRLGQFKSETLLGGSMGFWNLNMFDRPLVYNLSENLTYAGRDIGVDFRVDLPAFSIFELRGSAGVYNGDERAEERTDNELLYTFRGELAIPEIDLTLGAAAATHRQGIEDLNQTSGYSLSSRQTALSAGIELDYEISNWYDISIAAEASKGDNWEEVDVIVGEEAPEFRGYWAVLTAFYHPWDVQGIRTISVSAGYDKLQPNTDLESEDYRISVIGAIYPSENVRFRFGGVRNSVANYYNDDMYTDYMIEVGLKF